jgi:hypothetical protein
MEGWWWHGNVNNYLAFRQSLSIMLSTSHDARFSLSLTVTAREEKNVRGTAQHEFFNLAEFCSCVSQVLRVSNSPTSFERPHSMNIFRKETSISVAYLESLSLHNRMLNIA